MKIAIIGGGIAGSSAAIYLANLGLDVTLFEKKESLVDGPPMCHLHAGGNLYREISDNQCIQLLKESIELLRLYPKAIDFRPTIIATPTFDKANPSDLLPRLELLKKEYQKLIDEDRKNKVLGEVEDYYKLYSKEDILKLKEKEVTTPETLDDWMVPFAKNVDLEKIKFPVILVQEYGLNVFRIGASAYLMLKKFPNAKLKFNSQVLEVKEDKKFEIKYLQDKEIYEEEFDYVINSAGFESGKIDDSLNKKRERFVEFKAAYVTKWKNKEPFWPEIIFHGERGTPKGMGQFTPYFGGYFQLHAMTKDITLFENGLVKSAENSSQPKLDKKFIEIIEKGWDKNLVEERTKKAVNHLSNFIPSFSSANEAFKPLYGAQQIPGEDETLRAAEISFDGNKYARCEIVKASSVFAMADEIVQKLIKLRVLDKTSKRIEEINLDTKEVDELAMKLAQDRGYPKELGRVVFGV
jgi:hypothetical protein